MSPEWERTGGEAGNEFNMSEEKRSLTAHPSNGDISGVPAGRLRHSDSGSALKQITFSVNLFTYECFFFFFLSTVALNLMHPYEKVNFS